jgi:cation transport regulator ChaB
LERTSILATLDCPLPKHKNAIWCAAFQMAWDKLKNNIAREPIILSGAS